MDYDIFGDDKERRAALTDLQGLMESPGWKVMLAALDKNVEYEDEKLRQTKFDTVHEFYLQQEVVSHLRSLKLLPTLLVKDIGEKLVPEDSGEGDDAYDSPA